MPALAQPTAELWNTIFNLMLVLGAIAVMAGTWGAFWTGNMKEFYANARISANEALTAKANAEAASAKLKLEELRLRTNPRTVNEAIFLNRLANVPKRKVIVSWDEDLPESNILSLEVVGLLTRAGWDVTMSGQTTPDVARCARLGNLLVLSRHITDEDFAGLQKPPEERPNTPFIGLTDAFVKSMHDGEAGSATCPFVPEDVLQVVIGPRLVIIPKQ